MNRKPSMTDAPIAAAPAGLDHPFVRLLARLVRAEDAFGNWEGKSDSELLADFIVTRQQRRLEARRRAKEAARLDKVHRQGGAA